MNKFRPSRAGHMALGLMIGALLDGPQSVDDLVEASGLCHTTIRHYIATWRKQKVLRVAEWQPDARNRRNVAAFVFGRGKDATRPKASVSGDRWQAWKQRRQQMQMLNLLRPSTAEAEH